MLPINNCTYISDWKQYTSINGFNSDLINVYGKPKGLISGRHLFLTYISGLLQAIKYSKIHHFADDASLKFSSSIKLTNKQVNDNFKVNSQHIQQKVEAEMKIW